MAEDAVQLRRDGGIVITLGAEHWRLRRPTLGLMRKFHERWQSEVVEPSKAEVSDGLIEQATIDWIVDVVRALCDKEPFDVNDDSPPWLVNGGIGARFIQHWRSCPFQGSGGS